MIISRPKETEKIVGAKKWALVYGRRKTGKTFLVRNFVSHDEYFFVRTDRTVISQKDNAILSYDAFCAVLERSLADGKTVVVDEFHRLAKPFLDNIHYMEKKGRLILISSTLFLSKNLLSSNSPLLGLFSEVPVGLIKIEDTLRELKKHNLSKKELLEFAVLLAEPIAVDYFDAKMGSRKIFAQIVSGSVKTIPALTGEIFFEEQRALSAIYDGILRAVAAGKAVSGEISSYLFSRRLIAKDDPSIVQQYLNNLVSIGVLSKVSVFGKRRFYYRHVSPLSAFFYYADELYNISERQIGEKELERLLETLMPKVIEGCLRDYFSAKYSLQPTIIQEKDYEIDICLQKFKRPEIVIEIKWGRIGSKDIEKAEKNLSMVDAPRKIIFVSDKSGLKSSMELMDVSDL